MGRTLTARPAEPCPFLFLKIILIPIYQIITLNLSVIIIILEPVFGLVTYNWIVRWTIRRILIFAAFLDALLQVFISIALILGDGLYNFLKILFITIRNIHGSLKERKHSSSMLYTKFTFLWHKVLIVLVLFSNCN